MPIQRLEHVGIVVADLAGAIEFFAELGLTPGGRTTVEGGWVDRVLGLQGVSVEIAMLQTPDGAGRLELACFRSPTPPGVEPPAPIHAPGIRHVAFAVEDLDGMLARLRERGAELIGELVRYENGYRLCLVRGPEGIIVELAERIGEWRLSVPPPGPRPP